MQSCARALAGMLLSVTFPWNGALADAPPCLAANTLVDFVAQFTDYASLSDCPSVQMVSGEDVAKAVGVLRSETLERPMAAYLPKSNEILVDPEVELKSPIGQSYVVHELVHALQFQTGAADSVPCVGALEAEAYRVQAAYLRSEGLPDQAKAFWLYGLVIGSCAHAYHPDF